MKVYAIGKEIGGVFQMFGTKVYSTHAKALAALPMYVEIAEETSDLMIEDFEVTE